MLSYYRTSGVLAFWCGLAKTIQRFCLFLKTKKNSIFKIFRKRVTGPKLSDGNTIASLTELTHFLVVWCMTSSYSNELLHCPSTLKRQAGVCKRKTPLGEPFSKTCVSWMGLYSVEAGANQLLNGSGEHTHHTAPSTFPRRPLHDYNGNV